MKNLSKLFKQNKQWAEKITNQQPDFFEESAKGQSPNYLWIGCSDSRVPPTQLTGLGPGDLFVHRNIANVISHSDVNSQSVIQYAVSVLKVEHVVICGHYGCGGVQAAYEDPDLGLIDNWLADIQDVYRKHKNEIGNIGSEEEKLNRFCELNVLAQVQNTCHSPFVQQAWEERQELTVHGLIYDLKTGLLNDLDIHITSPEEAEDL
ncbi:carbonate dehydratase [Aliifodinibius salipaludis]|uniref:Carbonic anhydrase n=1 Tax=Fodinibius salipaludis TaxID=2032627 RepID=A0A2A2G8D1_9BACT|nr:carbonate dehydratase [Aliifodinibius salipaludis]PAU93871.1 carbonate dehydratase [Aliifodinibius salipaludis]